ncbi:MAG: hypothetical protein FJY85_04685 [Deltaproteobacteria bacterium]|nr:hypothetical protein [Deltaproteobacteria bacterium]
MKSKRNENVTGLQTGQAPPGPSRGRTVFESNIGASIDTLVEYLMDNKVDDIHSLIMGEVEKRLIIKVLERSRGNKRLAAKRLGMSRNTFLRKIRKVIGSDAANDKDRDA